MRDDERAVMEAKTPPSCQTCKSAAFFHEVPLPDLVDDAPLPSIWRDIETPCLNRHSAQLDAIGNWTRPGCQDYARGAPKRVSARMQPLAEVMP